MYLHKAKKIKLIVVMLLMYVFSNTLLYAQLLTPTLRNIDYVGNNTERQKLDIYIPAGLTAPAPVVVFIHGGGWYGGAKGAGNVAYFKPCFDTGFICVDIEYRVSGDSLWPAQIEDCKTAIRYLKANAELYNIDTCRFAVMGSSAGGHLSAMVGTSAAIEALEGLHQGYTNVTSRVQAVVDMFGPTDFSFMDGYYASSCGSGVLVHEYRSPETSLLGIDSLHNHPALVQTANPIAYITADDAKFFIIHGGADCSVPTYQSRILDSMLAVAGIPADSFIVAAGMGHGGPYYQNTARTNLYRDFLLRHLSNPCRPLWAALYWNGSVSEEWENPLNWEGNQLPEITSNVVIPSVVPHYPTVSVATEIKSIKLQPGSTVNMEPGILLKINGQ
jgi:acetyl esterase/lipase